MNESANRIGVCLFNRSVHSGKLDISASIFSSGESSIGDIFRSGCGQYRTSAYQNEPMTEQEGQDICLGTCHNIL